VGEERERNREREKGSRRGKVCWSNFLRHHDLNAYVGGGPRSAQETALVV
jgi:hypothetical protein